MAANFRVGIVADYREERWPSMDLVAAMLVEHLPQADPAFEPTLLRPVWRRRATALPFISGAASAMMVDRYLNRYGDYTWWLRRRAPEFDLFHIVDHSYAHLVHALPPGRVIVSCHDVDAFRCIREGGRPLYRRIARRILSGLRNAALVTCDTHATRDELVQADLLSPDRLVVIHNGVHPSLRGGADEVARTKIEELAGISRNIELLHVGSTIPRKRVDVAIRALALVRERRGGVTLLRAGGSMTNDQRRLASRLGVADAIVELPALDIDALAALYRRATLTILPSDYEGFGLPVIESLAAGTPVLASRIPALVEIGGKVVAYAEPGDAARWADSIHQLLQEREQEPGWWAHRREQGRRHAAAFSWNAYASAVADVYRATVGQTRRGVCV